MITTRVVEMLSNWLVRVLVVEGEVGGTQLTLREKTSWPELFLDLF